MNKFTKKRCQQKTGNTERNPRNKLEVLSLEPEREGEREDGREGGRKNEVMLKRERE